MGGQKTRKKKQPTSGGAKSKSKGAGAAKAPEKSSPAADANTDATRPKNHLITDATSPYVFRFARFGSPKSITVHQTTNDATWPGGALWDVGVLLARMLVMVQSPPPSPSSKELFVPRLVAPGVWGPRPWRDRRVLELGAGVGLTGLVAAALGARAVLLTDLPEVVDGVTSPNAERNAGAVGVGGPARTAGGGVRAATLSWGNETDEEAAARILDEMAPPTTTTAATEGVGRKKKKKGASATCEQRRQSSQTDRGTARPPTGIPDVLLVGDVAYQHKPGAPSHFDALLSTVLRFSGTGTLLVFGTRMRMPASADLLDMFREHFDEVVDPPVEAHELDPLFGREALGRRHNITVHLMRRKQSSPVAEMGEGKQCA